MVDLVQWSLFLLFSALVLGGALGVFLTMSMYRAGISLMLCLVAMAGLFILLEADMLAVIQVMMNVGGMLVMTLFMVMLMMDPGGEMMWDMKRRMRMKGFGALSMSMPAELPAEKPEEQGRALSPPHSHDIAAVPAGEGGMPGKESLPQEKEATSGTAEGNDGKQATVETTDGYRERGNTMTNMEAGTNGSNTDSSDPFRRMREMQRAIAIMQQQLGLMQEQLVELQEDLLVALPGGGQAQTPSASRPNNNRLEVPAAAHQMQMGQSSSPIHSDHPQENTRSAVYTCPMHPEIRQAGPGRCPKCGMELVAVEESPASSTATTLQSDTSSRASTGSGSGSGSGSSTTPTMYTCPMHPEVRLPGPGRCPKCGMDLVPQEGGSDDSDGDNGKDGSTGQGSTGHDSAGGGTESQGGGHDHGHMAHSSGMNGGGVETAEQMQRRSPKAYYRMMADMAMTTRQLPLAGLFSMLAGLLLVVLVLVVAWPSRPAAPDLDGPSRVGDLLLSNYMIAFEGAAFLILAGILGAVLLARRERKRQGARRKPLAATTRHKQEVH